MGANIESEREREREREKPPAYVKKVQMFCVTMFSSISSHTVRTLTRRTKIKLKRMKERERKRERERGSEKEIKYKDRLGH